jgi:hypothetical protein
VQAKGKYFVKVLSTYPLSIIYKSGEEGGTAPNYYWPPLAPPSPSKSMFSITSLAASSISSSRAQRSFVVSAPPLILATLTSG